MKLTCNVEVHCRLLSTTNLSTRKKAQRACLSIARPTMKTNDLSLFLQTTTNKLGTKYKIDGNIEKVFTKFIEDGKVTIRMKEPPHDLIIQSDAIQLKSFLHILKLGLSKKVDPSVLCVSNMTPKNLTVQKTKVVVTKKSDYPVLEGFPRTTEALYLMKLERKSFDRQILKLQSLKILDLSENQLTNLPSELGDLPNLTELYLASNRLSCSSKWSWMNGVNIRKTLRLLDLSNNSICHLSDKIGKLRFLFTLKLGKNSLIMVPHSIRHLTSLKYLELQKNVLDHLPGGMLCLRLEQVNISSNPFFSIKMQSESNKDEVPRLVDIAANVVIDTRMSYDAKMIPFTLVEYLDASKYCVCGKACFHAFVQESVEMNLQQIARSVISSRQSSVPFDCYFCSSACHRRYSRVT